MGVGTLGSLADLIMKDGDVLCCNFEEKKIVKMSYSTNIA